jgi:hypothetical protein
MNASRFACSPLQSTYGSTELGRHASARGVEELFAVFPADLNSTISDGLEQPFVHSAVLHSYDLIWMLAKGHTETSSAGKAHFMKVPG